MNIIQTQLIGESKMKKMSILAAISMSLAFVIGSQAIASETVVQSQPVTSVTPLIVEATPFMDVKQVISDSPLVAHTAEYIAHVRCQDEARVMVFKDSQGVLKSVQYTASNMNGCTDGDGGVNYL